MNHVSNLLDLAQIKQQRHQNKEKIFNTETASVINWLFRELRSGCPAFRHAWADNEEQTDAKKSWLKAFILSGINSIEQIEKGLNHVLLMEKPFIPSPGEFISWCKQTPQDAGLPSLKEAYDISILINRQFSDYKPDCLKTYEVIKHAIQQIGASTYRAMTSTEAFKVFEYYYTLACKQFMEDKLKGINKGLEDKSQKNNELQKQEDVVLDEFKNIKCGSSALDLMRGMLK